MAIIYADKNLRYFYSVIGISELSREILILTCKSACSNLALTSSIQQFWLIMHLFDLFHCVSGECGLLDLLVCGDGG